MHMRIDPVSGMDLTRTKPPGLMSEPVAPRDLVSIHDLAPAEILQLFNLTFMLKQRPADFRGVLAGKQMVMFFEKPSLRTRLTFEAGINSLGGVSFFVDQTQSRLPGSNRSSRPPLEWYRESNPRDQIYHTKQSREALAPRDL